MKKKQFIHFPPMRFTHRDSMIGPNSGAYKNINLFMKEKFQILRMKKINLSFSSPCYVTVHIVDQRYCQARV